LEKNPTAREFDSDLMLVVWDMEAFEKDLTNIHNITVPELFRRIRNKELTSPDTITRLSRLIKKAHPELKGKRKRKSEEEVIQELLVYKKDLFA